MHQQLAALRVAPPAPLGPVGRFTRLGVLKYGLSVAGGVAGWVVAGGLGGGHVAAAVLGFYLVEIQLLFLFPLALEGNPRPIRASVGLTWRIGPATCLVTVLGIAAYMLAGLARPRAPLRNWYVGCLAVLLWYVEETAIP